MTDKWLLKEHITDKWLLTERITDKWLFSEHITDKWLLTEHKKKYNISNKCKLSLHLYKSKISKT